MEAVKYRNTLFAFLLSLPLLPSLFVEKETLNQAINSDQVLLAAPVALEFLSFYFLYAFVKDRNSIHSASEKKALWVLVVGIFLIIGIPVLITAAASGLDRKLQIAFVTGFVYAFISLIINSKRIIDSSDKVTGYFRRRYILPGFASIVVTVVLALISPFTVNAVIAYYIFKNFTLTHK